MSAAVEHVPVKHHGVPRSTIHLIAQRCWQAAGHGPRYVYLTDDETECIRQHTEYMVIHAAPVTHPRYVPVVSFPMPGLRGGLDIYKAALITNLKDAWVAAKARGLA